MHIWVLLAGIPKEKGDPKKMSVLHIYFPMGYIKSALFIFLAAEKSVEHIKMKILGRKIAPPHPLGE